MAQSRFRYYLDDLLVQNEKDVEGWDTLISEINRDFSIHGLLINTKGTLTFRGDAYDYLDCKYNSTSFCNEIKLAIHQQCTEGEQFVKIVDGILRVSQFKKFMNKCAIEVPIEDNSYFARIKNNADIEAYPNVGKSKNGFTIPAATLSTMLTFDPSTGVNDGNTRYSYRAYELWKFIIAFISDDEIDFQSDLYDIGGRREGLFLTNGKHLSTGNSVDYQNPDIGKFSFKKLIDECYKLDNIGFRIDISGPKPVFILEESEGFYKPTVSEILQYANNVIRKVKTDQLYAQVNFGSSTTLDDPRCAFPESVNFIGFKDETLHLTGQCNVETTLDLKGDWIRDTNVIQDILMGITVNPQDNYDDNFIWIECEKVSAGVYQGIKYDILNTGALPVYYNGGLTNDKIAQRFLGGIPTSLVSFLTEVDVTFHATKTNTTTKFYPGTPFFEPIPYQDDATLPTNFDPHNQYNNSTYEYEIFDAGIFNFKSINNINFQYTSQQFDGLTTTFHATLRVYDNLGIAGGNLLQTHILETKNISPNRNTWTFFTLGGSKSINCSQGDKVSISIDWTATSIFIDTMQIQFQPGSYFESLDNSLGGGAFQEYDPEDFKAEQYSFDYPISNSRFNNIKANPMDKLGFNIDGMTNIYPWIENLKYHHSSKLANLTLLGKSQIFDRDCRPSLELEEDGGRSLREDSGLSILEK